VIPRISKDGGIEPMPPPRLIAVYRDGRQLRPDEWTDLGDGLIELAQPKRKGETVTFQVEGGEDGEAARYGISEWRNGVEVREIGYKQDGSRDDQG
jgi:hypothetical protein